MRHLFLRFLCLSSVLLSGCIDRYTPEVPPAERANLVVDGFINPLGGTVIKLSRTFSVNTKNAAPVEAKAQLVVQDDQGRRYPLTEAPAGTYSAGTQALPAGRSYQLRITTAQGREYASDLLPVVLTPPITALRWQLTDVQGVQVYLSTQGSATAPRYYRWDYAETYQFTSAFEPTIEYVASRNKLRPLTVSLHRCWRTEPSTTIVQGNTEQLSQNTLTDFPLLTLLPSMKLRYGYSLLVRQVAQEQAEYDYWERLRKNTENLGTVNDPLPGRVTGNVHALADAAEPVLGYVGVHSVTEQRLFIDAAQLPTPRPGSVFFDPAYASCLQTQDVQPVAAALQLLRGGTVIAVLPVIKRDTGDTIGVAVSSAACADCRLRGTNVKPSFWP